MLFYESLLKRVNKVQFEPFERYNKITRSRINKDLSPGRYFTRKPVLDIFHYAVFVVSQRTRKSLDAFAYV